MAAFLTFAVNNGHCWPCQKHVEILDAQKSKQFEQILRFFRSLQSSEGAMPLPALARGATTRFWTLKRGIWGVPTVDFEWEVYFKSPENYNNLNAILNDFQRTFCNSVFIHLLSFVVIVVYFSGILQDSHLDSKELVRPLHSGTLLSSAQRHVHRGPFGIVGEGTRFIGESTAAE